MEFKLDTQHVKATSMPISLSGGSPAVEKQVSGKAEDGETTKVMESYNKPALSNLSYFIIREIALWFALRDIRKKGVYI